MMIVGLVVMTARWISAILRGEKTIIAWDLTQKALRNMSTAFRRPRPQATSDLFVLMPAEVQSLTGMNLHTMGMDFSWEHLKERLEGHAKGDQKQATKGGG